ncbi:hypothetical protein ACFLUZ_07490 [Chloroflexota bacterium]
MEEGAGGGGGEVIDMKTVKVFVDTSTVNRILEVDIKKSDPKYEEDRFYLFRIMQEYVEKGFVQLFVNPSVKHEVENTPDVDKKGKLLELFNKFHYTDFNKTIFPFTFPASFVTEEEKLMLEELRTKIKDFSRDDKPFLDAVSNSDIDVLLTTDRKHLACIKLRSYISGKELDTEIKIFTPKEFYECLRKGGSN